MKPELQRRVQRYGWDRAADFYEASWKRQLRPAQEKLLEIIALHPGERVVETACGTGLITFDAAETVGPEGRVTATDISEVMIRMAREAAAERGVANVEFHRMDAETLELEEESHDVALCSLGLMYVPDPVGSLKELHRVLKPVGRAGAAVWGERNRCGWAEIFPVVDKRVKSDVCPLFFQQGTGDVLERSFREAGFGRIGSERLSVTLHYPGPGEAVMAAFAGGPVALAYRNFDEKTREEAHEEYLASIDPYRNDNGYAIPGEFVVTVGYRE